MEVDRTCVSLIADNNWCQAFDTEIKVKSLQFLALTVTLVYILCLVLGFRNSYTILYQQGYYKSPFLALHYVFGQTIAGLRIASMMIFIIGSERVYESGFCDDLENLSKKMHDPAQLRKLYDEYHTEMLDIYWVLLQGILTTSAAMFLKFLLGLIVLASVISLHDKVS